MKRKGGKDNQKSILSWIQASIDTVETLTHPVELSKACFNSWKFFLKKDFACHVTDDEPGLPWWGVGERKRDPHTQLGVLICSLEELSGREVLSLTSSLSRPGNADSARLGQDPTLSMKIFLKPQRKYNAKRICEKVLPQKVMIDTGGFEMDTFGVDQSVSGYLLW